MRFMRSNVQDLHAARGFFSGRTVESTGCGFSPYVLADSAVRAPLLDRAPLEKIGERFYLWSIGDVQYLGI